MRIAQRLAALLVALACMPAAADAQQTPPGAAAPFAGPLVSPIFSDHMVLQRDRKDPIWGWAAPGSSVTVTVTATGADGHSQVLGQPVQTVCGADGRWQTTVGPLKSGPTYSIAVDGPHIDTLSDILAGDVWICTGQSNMEFGVTLSKGWADVSAQANNPMIRLCRVDHGLSVMPASVPRTSGWEVCTTDTVSNPGWGGFSAVGYYFGSEIQHEVGVPIGLIQDCWGGTPAESWASLEGLQSLPDQKSAVDTLMGLRQSATDYDAPTPMPDKGGPSQNGVPNSWTPSALYDAMIAPVAPYGIKGAIWYQGESNAGHGYAYRTILPTMIGNWRAAWGEGDFPFYIMSLASWKDRTPEPADDGWQEVRESQDLTATTLPNCGVAMNYDVGDAKDIHPKDKATMGHRLALVALANTYGRKKLEFSGPWYRSMKVENGAIRISFDHIGGGLMVGQVEDNGSPTPPDELKTLQVQSPGPLVLGFQIAGADHNWVWASAAIEGKDVVVWSPSVPTPVAVRYAWSANPAADLFNKAGLPAVPFRTDDWRLITQPSP